jgi:hypothetical protein
MFYLIIHGSVVLRIGKKLPLMLNEFNKIKPLALALCYRKN